MGAAGAARLRTIFTRQNTPGFTPDMAGSYVVQLVADDGQINGTPDTVTITVNPPEFRIVTSAPTVSEDAGTVTLTVGRVGGATSATLAVEWRPGG